MKPQPRTLVGAIAASLALAGCAGGIGMIPGGTGPAIPGTERYDPASIIAAGGGIVAAGGGNIVAAGGGNLAGSVGKNLAEGGPVGAAAPVTAPMPMAPGSDKPAVATEQRAPAMTAGAVDDNAGFSAYLKYLGLYKGPTMRPLDVSKRQIIRVVDLEGKTVADADVAITLDGKAVESGKTYANGERLFFPAVKANSQEEAPRFTVTAHKGDATFTGTFPVGEAIWEAKLGSPVVRPATKLQVAFVLDATGSMGGEIQQLQSTIKDISTRIRALPSQPALSFALVHYRDKGDDYRTKKADFTPDLAKFTASLNTVAAGGGGDIPEDMESALDVAVNDLTWAEADAVRLTFLVADAPPHVDYPDTTPYTTSMKRASERGIKLFTVGTSGMKADGEYVMRQLAQFTQARYLFVTRGGDESTGGDGAASATVDQFKSGRLDDVVVGIVSGELDHLTR